MTPSGQKGSGLFCSMSSSWISRILERYLTRQGGTTMYINGKAIKELRETIEMSQHELAEHLALDTSVLENYEQGVVVWFEEDLFRLITLQEIMPDNYYLLDGEYTRDFMEIEKEYGL